MTSTLRTFIAIELPETAKASLAEVVSTWREGNPPNVQWIGPNNLHFTLKFLGDIRTEQVEEVTAKMHKVVEGVPPFTLRFNMAGAFPNLRRPRVLWVGTRTTPTLLHHLHKKLDDALLPIGFPLEMRAFVPHLTLGRLAVPDRVPVVSPKALPTIACRVDTLSLMESVLTPDGALYKHLYRVTLSK